MALSRLAVASSLVVAAACGSSSNNKQPDAAKHIDAEGVDSTAQVDEGTICTGTGTGDQDLCGGDDSTFECVSLNQSSHFFCTLGCGSGPCGGSASSGSDAGCTTGSGSDAPQPPSNGDAMCQTAVEASGGTGEVKCILFAADPQGSGNDSVDWTCGILCNQDGSNDFGSCPTGLTCTNNICQ
jgi:hypothetical protein